MSKNRSIANMSLFCFFIIAYIYSFQYVTAYRNRLKKIETVRYLPSVRMLGILSMDYKGLVSKFLFFKAIVYDGEMLSNAETDWDYLYKVLNLSSIIEPYNGDTYYLAQATLPWDAGYVKETITMLEKGEKYRPWDWDIPFLLGFDYFYFLKDKKRAAIHMKRAAKINSGFNDLAIRFNYNANEIEISLEILKKMYEDAEYEKFKKGIQGRIIAYERALKLEKAIRIFEKKFGFIPKTLDSLVEKGVLTNIPEDIYGGKYYFDQKDNIVKTTSNYRPVKK